MGLSCPCLRTTRSGWDVLLSVVKVYSFVNRTIQLWNQLPADVLRTLSYKPSNFRKRVKKVII
jgi:hypothetical protein